MVWFIYTVLSLSPFYLAFVTGLPETCNRNFRFKLGKIILIQESIEFGAKFIEKVHVNSFNECYFACCNLSTCTSALYGPNFRQSCFLFDCSLPGQCVYSDHKDFDLIITDEVRTANSSVRHMVNLNERCDSNHLCRSNNSICSNGFCVCQSGWLAKKGQCIPSVCTSPELQFQCDDSSTCVAIYDRCNKIVECPDGSDEESCPDAGTLKDNDVGKVNKSDLSESPHSSGKQQTRPFKTSPSWERFYSSPREGIIPPTTSRLLSSEDINDPNFYSILKHKYDFATDYIPNEAIDRKPPSTLNRNKNGYFVDIPTDTDNAYPSRYSRNILPRNLHVDYATHLSSRRHTPIGEPLWSSDPKVLSDGPELMSLHEWFTSHQPRHTKVNFKDIADNYQPYLYPDSDLASVLGSDALEQRLQKDMDFYGVPPTSSNRAQVPHNLNEMKIITHVTEVPSTELPDAILDAVHRSQSQGYMAVLILTLSLGLVFCFVGLLIFEWRRRRKLGFWTSRNAKSNPLIVFGGQPKFPMSRVRSHRRPKSHIPNDTMEERQNLCEDLIL